MAIRRRLSLVTVTRNNLDGLRRTADSIRGQVFRDFEWIVVDGASNDGSVEFLQSLPNDAKFVSEADCGIYDAMRKGLYLASTDYVLFLNAGDTLAGPVALNEVGRRLDGREVLFFAVQVVGARKSWVRLPRELKSARYSVPAIQQGTVYLKKSLLEVDWPTAYKICGDYSIAAQLYRSKASYESVPVVISVFELGGVSTTNVLRLMSEAWAIQRDTLGAGLAFRMLCALRRLATGVLVWFMFIFTR